MPSELLYWSLLSALVIVPCGAAVLIMLLTSRKTGLSIILSLILNIILTVIASIWWYTVSEEPPNYTMGRIVFFAVTFVSTEIFILFALFALKKNPETETNNES